jgi:hypothetical protein
MVELDYSGLACVSIMLYASLAIVAGYYFFKFRSIKQKSSYLGSSYDEPKIFFFFVLSVSALLDIPTFLGCLAKGGPEDCEWDDASYPVVWFCHLIAVCGYAFAITIPCVMWLDMVNRKDGKLFFSSFPYDKTKRFFQFLIILYYLITLVDMTAAIVDFRVSDHSRFQSRNVIDAICTTLEPVVIFCISLGCLWCGMRLQKHVVDAKFAFKTVIRVLCVQTIIMLIIALSYLARALLILRLVYFMPGNYFTTFACSYAVWLLCTRWLPYIFCSFCLIASMRSSGAEVAARNLREKAFSDGIDTSRTGIQYVSVVHMNTISDEEAILENHAGNISISSSEEQSIEAYFLLSSSIISDITHWNQRHYESIDGYLSIDNVFNVLTPQDGGGSSGKYTPPRPTKG